jgi:AbrB family looped-hinge helix DNA binding protein
MAMVTIDRLGRIVVPKPLRNALGLLPGTELELIEEPDGFRLVVSAPAPTIEVRDGLPVIVAQRPVRDSDVDTLAGE